jgi:polysaccharide export outer membrane protein
MKVFLSLALALMPAGAALETQAQDNSQSTVAAQSPATATAEEYRIGSLDQVQVSVYGLPELTPQGLITVDSGGTISLPGLGTVQAVGKTQHELEREIEAQLRTKQSVLNPNVTVQIPQHASRIVSVYGAVKAAGTYQMDRQWSLAVLIARAGGFADNVGKSVQIKRASDGSVVVVDVEDLDNSKVDPPVYTNDIVSVSLAGTIVVGGEVNNPGQLVLTRGHTITVFQALSLARNTTKDAKKKESVIIRKHEDGTTEDIKVDVEKIMARTTDDVQLIDGDVLYVPPDKVKSNLNLLKNSAVQVAIGKLIYF